MSAEADRKLVERWWPESGSCREDCPHEIAKRVRDAALEKHAQEMRDDPQLTADIAEFRSEMDIIQAGGAPADELRRKWYERESTGALKMMVRCNEEVLAIQATLNRAMDLLRRWDEYLDVASPDPFPVDLDEATFAFLADHDATGPVTREGEGT